MAKKSAKPVVSSRLGRFSVRPTSLIGGWRRPAAKFGIFDAWCEASGRSGGGILSIYLSIRLSTYQQGTTFIMASLYIYVCVEREREITICLYTLHTVFLHIHPGWLIFNRQCLQCLQCQCQFLRHKNVNVAEINEQFK